MTDKKEEKSSHVEMTPKEEQELMEKKRKALFNAISKIKREGIGLDTKRTFGFKYEAEQIERFLQNPSQNQSQLRRLSDYWYDVSSEYRIIVDYMSTLGKYNYVIDTLNFLDEDTDFKAFEKAKLKVAKQLDKMSLPHEFSKIMRQMWKHDVFYGYEREGKDSYTIQHMNPDYCRLSGYDFDGVFLYEFDFSFFDGNEEALEGFPEEFKRKYDIYRNTNEKWQELDSDKAFAFKVNEEITGYPLLPFSSLFIPIMDLEEAKKMHKAKAKMDNFMLLVQRIPINDKSQNMDDFLISLETAFEFHELAVAGLSDNPGIGFITSPMEIDSIRTDKGGKSERDNMSIALRSVFDAGGISQFLANSDKSTSTGVNLSVIVDEQKVFKIFRQFERWLNRKIRKMPGRYKFKVRLLDTTNFDDGDKLDEYLKGAQSGLPVIDEIASSLGINYLDLNNKVKLENSEVSLQDLLKPFQSSHTMSSKDDERGRPKTSDKDASDSTIINRDNNTDEDWQNE